jgi:hypothetical protein
MANELNIRTVQNHVVISCNGIGVGIPWEGGLEFSSAINRLAKFSRKYAKHKRHELVKPEHEKVCRGEITIFRTGLEFVFVLRGKEWIRCPWQAALEIAKTVNNQAAALEEIANHSRVIEDSALLLRTGLPIGITGNRKILKEAWKAAEDVEFPGMVEPKFVCFTPNIQMSPPPGGTVEKLP